MSAVEFDAEAQTKATLDGIRKLLEEQEDATPDQDKVRGLVLRLGVLQAYLGLVASELPLEVQTEIRALALELFKAGKDIRENPKRGT